MTLKDQGSVTESFVRLITANTSPIQDPTDVFTQTEPKDSIWWKRAVDRTAAIPLLCLCLGVNSFPSFRRFNKVTRTENNGLTCHLKRSHLHPIGKSRRRQHSAPLCLPLLSTALIIDDC